MATIGNVRYWFNVYLRYMFFRSLRREVRQLPSPPAFGRLKRDIHHEMGGIYAQNAARMKDKADPFNLEWLALVLAAYRALLPLVDSSGTAANIVGAAFANPFRKITKPALIVRYGISPWRPRSAFAIISRSFKPKGERFFGRSFIYEQEVLDERQSFINIRRCFFFEFFQANGAPELTRLFCHVDRIFMDELNQPKYGLRFERPTAMGYGDDICRFQFTRKIAEHPDGRR